MNTTRLFGTIISGVFLSCGATYAESNSVLAASPAPDATLYTTYYVYSAHTLINWGVCGSTQNSEGCFGGGYLGPYGKVGAILEGNPKINRTANTVTRDIYILDVAAGSDQTGVVLYIYKKVDQVTSDFDNATLALSQTLDLPVHGSTTARAFMAANDNFVFVGTSRSPEAIQIDKRSFAMTQRPGGYPPINLSAITADKHGYVT